MTHKYKRRIAVALAVTVMSVAFATAASTTSAFAADSCPSWTTTYGSWNYQQEYTYFTKDRWCMYDNYPGATVHYRMVWQSDGNLVVYTGKTGTNATWASNTYQRGDRLVFQRDGNMVIYDKANHPIWASNTYKSKAQTEHLIYQLNFYYKNPTEYAQISSRSPVTGVTTIQRWWVG